MADSRQSRLNRYATIGQVDLIGMSVSVASLEQKMMERWRRRRLRLLLINMITIWVQLVDEKLDNLIFGASLTTVKIGFNLI